MWGGGVGGLESCSRPECLIALRLDHLLKVKEDGEGGAVGRAKVGLDGEVHAGKLLLRTLHSETETKEGT